MLERATPGAISSRGADADSRGLNLPALGEKISALERWAERIERMQAERDGNLASTTVAPESTFPSTHEPPPTEPVIFRPQPAPPRFSARVQDLEPATGAALEARGSRGERARRQPPVEAYVSILQQAHAALLEAQRAAHALVQGARLESARRLARAHEEAQEIRAAADIAARRLVAAADEMNELRIELAERQAESLLASAREQLERLVTGATSDAALPREVPLAGAPAAVPSRPTDGQPATTPSPAESRATAVAGAGQDERSRVSEEERHALFPVRSEESEEQVPERPSPAPLRLAQRSAGTGEFDVVAGPFDRFEHLTRFTLALRALPGMRAVTVRRFAKRMVHLRLHFRGTEPLVALVEGLRDFAPKVVRQDARRLEVRVGVPSAVEPVVPDASTTGQGVA